MINKKSKTALQFILGGIMLVSIATIGCNNDSSDKKDAKADSTTTEKMKEEAPAPAAADTTPKMDTASTRPIIKTN